MKIIQASSPEQIPSVIQGEMLMRGKSQALLASELGFTEKHISQMLTGKAGISISNLFKILTHLDLALVLSPNPHASTITRNTDLLVAKLREKASSVKDARSVER